MESTKLTPEEKEFKLKFIEASELYNNTDYLQYFTIESHNTGGYHFIIIDRNIEYDEELESDMDLNINWPTFRWDLELGDCTGEDYGEINVSPWILHITDENIKVIIDLLKRSLEESIKYNNLRNGEINISNQYTVSWLIRPEKGQSIRSLMNGE